ncbi:peptidoglycan-binding domain-containing protein [Rhodobacter maris]|uniref:Putative peptidoglycan binding protein n=1 Tax=Rhodobacter maris TaxID=446682 RepID=A0A285SMM4_9RHOB|nr:peptidoglycan-binding domain-containing protein [Rhodobacter maris]SOC09297.1 putative peptidoglycan binding protein [Rhodobacter maris]
MPRLSLSALALPFFLCACVEQAAQEAAPPPSQSAVAAATRDGAPIVATGAAVARLTLAGEWRDTSPGAQAPGCYHVERRPAVVETVTEHALVAPEKRDPVSGVVLEPARYNTITEARIVEGGERLWFRRVCDADLTPEHIQTLQRALAARGLYAGPETGRIDRATTAAIRAYQSQRGLISPVLSQRAAEQMGVILWRERPVP